MVSRRPGFRLEQARIRVSIGDMPTIRLVTHLGGDAGVDRVAMVLAAFARQG